MKKTVAGIILVMLFFQNRVSGQEPSGSNEVPAGTDSSFYTGMCIGKTLSYYRKIYATNDADILRLEVFDHKQVLIAEGLAIRSKRNKYLPHGGWRFYTETGKLRKSGSYEKGKKINYWIDYNADGTEFYKLYYFGEEHEEPEKIAIPDTGPGVEVYLDTRQLVAGIEKYSRS